MKTIRMFEAFAGYGSQSIAAKRIQRDFPDDVRFESAGISEIEPNAIKAYRAIHGDTTNYGDISKIDWSQVPDFDLFTYSFPCQDISNAGKQSGFSEGSDTRSSLLWECEKAIRDKRPKYLLMENVKALVQQKFMPDFNRWIALLESYGYANFWQVLNAKDYGVAQNRERVFMVSILRTEEGPNPTYNFPKGFPLTKCVEDYMEPAEDIGEEYYISQDRVTGKVLSDMLDQPNVREEMEKLYHEEIKAAIADGTKFIIDESEPWWTFVSAELIAIQNAFNPKLRLHILYRDRMEIVKDVDCDWYERDENALDKTIAEVTNVYRLSNIGECEDTIRELYHKWKYGE